MFLKKIAFLSLLLSSLTLASELLDNEMERMRARITHKNESNYDIIETAGIVTQTRKSAYSGSSASSLSDGSMSWVLHAGGCEYPEGTTTVADCLASGALFELAYGALFERMFPSLYDTPTPSIVYFPRADSDLTFENDHIKMARQINEKTPPREHILKVTFSKNR